MKRIKAIKVAARGMVEEKLARWISPKVLF